MDRRSSRNRSRAGAAAAEGNSQEKKVAKIIISMGFRSYIREFYWRIFDALPTFTAMGIGRWEWFEFRLPFGQKWQEQEQQQETASSAAGEK